MCRRSLFLPDLRLGLSVAGLDEQTIQRLRALRWWDWPDEDLRMRHLHFFSRDVTSVIVSLDAVVKRLRKAATGARLICHS